MGTVPDDAGNATTSTGPDAAGNATVSTGPDDAGNATTGTGPDAAGNATTGTHDATWALLRDLATEAMTRAYAPYSHYPVGAAALVEDGRTVSGCNVENAALGVTLCAECGLISELVRSGGGRLVAFTCVDGEGRILVPCGRCRQLLWEHGGPELELLMPAGVRTLEQVLPDAFGPRYLENDA